VLFKKYIFHSVVKVETKVVACHSYVRSHTEINNPNMALLKKYILKRLFCEAGPENIANVETEVVACHSYKKSHTEINNSNMDGIEIDALELEKERR
jgi:hypothetical protein